MTTRNLDQILEGIDDQASGITATIAESEAEIKRLQELIPVLQADIQRLQQMKVTVSQLSSHS